MAIVKLLRMTRSPFSNVDNTFKIQGKPCAWCPSRWEFKRKQLELAGVDLSTAPNRDVLHVPRYLVDRL